MNFFNSSSNQTGDFAPLNLQKDDILDLTKTVPSLKNCIVGCGWDINVAGADNYDLDLSAFMLDKDRRIKRSEVNSRVVFFRALAQEGIALNGDNQTGAGEGDDERITVNLDKIPADVYEIVFNVNIFDAIPKKQTFGKIQNSYIRLLDADNNEKEIARYELKEKASNATAVTFASLMRRPGGGWDFKIISDSLVVADLNQLLLRYISM